MKKYLFTLGLALFTLSVSAHSLVFVKLGNHMGKTPSGDLCYIKVTGNTITVGHYQNHNFWRAITVERSDIQMTLQNGVLKAQGSSYEDSAIKITAKVRADGSIEQADFNMGFGYSNAVKCLNMK